MEFLRRTLKQIQVQLQGLSLSQRFVIVLLLVVMLGSIYWMARYSASREMVPLLNQTFKDSELSRIQQELDKYDDNYEIKGSKIYVQKSQQRKILARLTYAEALPQDISVGWNSLLAGDDIWMPESSRETKKKIILQQELARTISSWPGVRKAEVFINEGGKRRISNILPAASASVSITTDGGGGSLRKLASSAATLVASANNRMKRDNVQVIINGSHVPVATEGQEVAGEYMEEMAKWEDHYRNKILDVLPMRGALVQVDIKLDTTSRTREMQKVAPEGQGTLLVKTEKTSSETDSSSKEVSQEPGVVANVSTSASGGGSGTKSTTEDTTEKTMAIPGHELIHEVTPAGGITKQDMTATVNIPLSYFEEIAKRESKDKKKEPSPTVVKAVMDREIPKLKQIVMGAIGLAGSTDYSNHVVVQSYWAGGLAPGKAGQLAGLGTAAGAVQSAGMVKGIISNYGKDIAVSLLAVFSLFMVLMMMRRASSPVEDIEEETMMVMGKKPLEAVGVEEANIEDGEEEAAGVLTGVELEKNALRSQQILEQVRNMVGESPDVAAKLVSKWIAGGE